MISIESTLYERLGGAVGIETLVDRFYARVVADPILAPFFRNTSMDTLVRMQRELMGAAFGGPHRYGGLDLAWVHHGRGITTEHFNQFFQYLISTLEELGVVPDDVSDVVHRISVYKNQITGEAY
jgi:hemoglobin